MLRIVTKNMQAFDLLFNGTLQASRLISDVKSRTVVCQSKNITALPLGLL